MTVDQDIEEKSTNIQLFVYDISHGLAKIYSKPMLGIDLDAIYHTGIVAYGHEYYFDQEGTVKGLPKQTRFGTPLEIIELGETFIPQDIFEDYLNDLKTGGKFSLGSYNLFYNNCNHFSNEAIQFLNGGQIEERILNLPEQVLTSPNGGLIQQLFSGGF